MQHKELVVGESKIRKLESNNNFEDLQELKEQINKTEFVQIMKFDSEKRNAYNICHKILNNLTQVTFIQIHEFEELFKHELYLLLYYYHWKGEEFFNDLHSKFKILREEYETRKNLQSNKQEIDLRIRETIYLMDKSGMFESEYFKNNSNVNRNKLISKILKCHIDSVRKYFESENSSGTSINYPTLEERTKLDLILKEYSNKKK